MAEQLLLFDVPNESHIVSSFSHGNLCDDSERRKLEDKYRDILIVTDKFDRRSVSYQLNKGSKIHNWLKYKEGFSSELVNMLLDEMNIPNGGVVMDPFAGSGTTLITCMMRGINSIGCDVMPISEVAVNAKADIMNYNLVELHQLSEEFAGLVMPEDYAGTTPCITITRYAYPPHNERFIHYASEWIKSTGYSENAQNLFTLCMINSLEQCSYTSKSGQYLSWDSRSQKVIDANKQRSIKGQRLLPENLCRDEIADVHDTVLEKLRNVISDINAIQKQRDTGRASVNFKLGSALYELPEMDSESIDGVITSPPYCNRYDYTRTYALELVYLGMNEEDIKRLRQNLISCTVESRPKIDMLTDLYNGLGKTERFVHIQEVIRSNKAFSEILSALNFRKANGDLNNSGIIRMVEGYFTELTFIYAELYRLCRKGAYIASVNDNVRYGGEVIPVDFLTTSLAEDLGFKPIRVYCLKQQKGNSSQQMKKYGRIPLRKSITIWQKV